MGIKFEKDGAYSNQDLEFNESDGLGFATAYTGVYYRDCKKFNGYDQLSGLSEDDLAENGKLVLGISFATRGESVDGAADLAVVLGHESFIHNKNTDKTMAAYKSGNIKAAISTAKRNQQLSGPDGDNDHDAYGLNPSKFKTFNSYISNLKKLALKYGFDVEVIDEQRKDHDEKYIPEQ